MDVIHAIRIIIQNHGYNILDSPQKFQSMVMDYAKGCDEEKRLFCICCHRGMLNFAQEIIRLEDRDKIKDTAMKAKARLEQEAFMSEQNAIVGVNMFLEGLGVDFEIATVQDISENSIPENRIELVGAEKQEIQAEDKSLLTRGKKDIINNNLIRDLEELALGGDLNAMISLGDCYRHGIAVRENWRMAKYYYRNAAELGSKEGKYKYIELINKHKL